MGTTSWPNMTPVILSRRHPYLYSDGGDGNYATYSPLYANLGARTAHPRWHRSTQDEAWPYHVAPADGEAKRSTPITSLCCRRNYFHQIRRKTAAPEATFFVFLFHLFPLHLFTTNVTWALPLKTIKGEAGATSKDTPNGTNVETRNIHTSLKQQHTRITPQRDRGSAPSLESLWPLLRALRCEATRATAECIGRRAFLARISIHPCVRFAHHPGLDAPIQIHSSLCLDHRFSRHRQYMCFYSLVLSALIPTLCSSLLKARSTMLDL
jgi:hypothetical protein